MKVIYISDDVHKRLKIAAFEESKFLHEFVNKIIEDYLKQRLRLK